MNSTKIAKNVVTRLLKATENRISRQATVQEVLERANSARGSLTESSAKEPLAKTHIQYIRHGDSYQPAGNVTLVDSLGPCPFEIKMTMTGPVFERVNPPSDEILYFKDSIMDRVVKEVDRFWERKDQYEKLGLVQNRGIILAGPPGTGKSIVLHQVIEMMTQRGDVVFLVKSADAILEGMKVFREIEPTRKVVIAFEEADELFNYNERTMLRIMDGDAKIGGVLFLGTTNYLERMSPRSLRPGRFDKKIYVGYPTYEQRLQYLTKKLEPMNESSDKIAYMAKQTDGMGFGHLRELVAAVYAIGDDLEETLKSLRASPR